MKRYLSFLYILLPLVIASCAELAESDNAKPTVVTLDATQITRSTAVLNGETTGGAASMLTRGVCFSESELVSFNDRCVAVSSGTGPFSVMTHELKPTTTYYIRAFAMMKDGGLVYGDLKEFTTSDFQLADMKMEEPGEILSREAVMNASILYSGDYPVNQYGFVYSTVPDVILESNGARTVLAQKEGDRLSGTLTELETGTTYYVKAYAQTEQGTGYSDEIQFTTSDRIPADLGSITIIDNTVSYLRISSSILDPHGTVTGFGFCWSTTNTVPGRNDETVDLTGKEFVYSIEGYTPNTRLYIRAYAVNEAGINYSPVLDIRVKSYDCRGNMVIVIPPEEFYIGWLGDPEDVSNEAVYGGAQDGLFANWSKQNSTYSNPSKVKGLKPYRIAAYEVTFSDYVEFLNNYRSNTVKEGSYKGKLLVYKEWSRMNYDEATGLWSVPEEWKNHPATGITWYGANEFCTFYGGFLPNEPQWECAARGNIYTDTIDPDPENQMYMFSGSNDINEVAVWNQGESTSPVGTKKPNRLGIYDMTGNAQEFTRTAWFRYPANWIDNLSDTSTEFVARGGRCQRGVQATFHNGSRDGIKEAYDASRHPFVGFRFCDSNVE